MTSTARKEFPTRVKVSLLPVEVFVGRRPARGVRGGSGHAVACIQMRAFTQRRRDGGRMIRPEVDLA